MKTETQIIKDIALLEAWLGSSSTAPPKPSIAKKKPVTKDHDSILVKIRKSQLSKLSSVYELSIKHGDCKCCTPLPKGGDTRPTDAMRLERNHRRGRHSYYREGVGL